MASEAVRKILDAEAESARKNAEALRRSEEIITDAERYSAIAVQKKISEAYAETEKIREEYRKKFEIHFRKAESECLARIERIRKQAERNAENAVNVVIREFF